MKIGKLIKTLPKNLKQFLLQTLIFAGLFILVSGIIGPWVISTKLLYGFNFYIYGNLGKMVIFSLITYFLLTKDRLAEIKAYPFKKINLLYIFVAFALIPLFFTIGKELLTYKSFTTNLPLSLLGHLILIAIPSLLIPGVFGWQFIKYFTKTFAKEIKICACLSVVFFIAIFYVWRLWPYLSHAVLYSVYLMLKTTFSSAIMIPPTTLIVEHFGVRVEQACSGLDSLFLFSCLYLLISLIDWKILNHKKLLLLFVPAAIGLFLTNILRVYLLILIGVLISPAIAVQLFHTYAGMILFIIYFGIFWKLSYKFLKIKKPN